MGTFQLYFELIGAVAFAISGAALGIRKGMDLFGVAMVGMTTAVGGGMIRDVLLQEMPFVLKKRVYAVAAIAGALSYWVLETLGMAPALAYGIGWAVTVSLRLMATVFRWNLPKAL